MSRRDRVCGFEELHSGLLDLKALLGEHGSLEPVIVLLASWPEYVREAARETAAAFLEPVPARSIRGADVLVEVTWLWGYLIGLLVMGRSVTFDEALSLERLSRKYRFRGTRHCRIDRVCGLPASTAIADRICLETCRSVLAESLPPSTMATLFLAMRFAFENALAVAFAGDSTV